MSASRNGASPRLCANGKTRAENVAEAQRLRAQGLLVREIAERLGATRSTVAAWIDDPDLSKQKARRAGYAGVCVDCGGPTDGGNGRAKASKRCAPCELAYRQTDEYRLAHTLWTRERIIAAMYWWASVYGEPPAMADWNPWNARQEYHDEERAKRAEQHLATGQIPWFTHVVERFGSWNAGIEAAGFKPRPNHGITGRHRSLRRTHCAHNHEFTEKNTIWTTRGHRRCRLCYNAAKRRWYARHRAREKATA